MEKDRWIFLPPKRKEGRKALSLQTKTLFVKFRKPNTHKRQKPTNPQLLRSPPKRETNGRVTGDTCEHAGEGGGVDPSERFIGSRPEPDHLGLRLWPVSQPSRPHSVVSHLSSRWLRGWPVQDLYGHRVPDSDSGLHRRHELPQGQSKREISVVLSNGSCSVA